MSTFIAPSFAPSLAMFADQKPVNMEAYHTLRNKFADYLPTPVWRDARHAFAVRGWLRARRHKAVQICERTHVPDMRVKWQTRADELTTLIRMSNRILVEVFGLSFDETRDNPYDPESYDAVWDAVRGDPTLERFLAPEDR